jgi:hypothetical protein
MEYLFSKEAMSAYAKGSHAARDRYLRDLGYMPVGEPNKQQEVESPQRDLPDRRRGRRNKKQQGSE